MILDAKEGAQARGGVLGELAEPRRPRNDLAHFVRSDFVAAEPKKFTRHVLNLAHAQTKRHQLGTDRHQPAAHQPGEAAVAVGGRNRRLRAWNLVDQSLDLVGGPLVTEETQNDADGFFSDSAIDAGLGGQPSNQFVHIAPPSAGLLPGRPCEIYLERLRSEIQAIRAREGDFRSRSLVECCSNARVIARFTLCCRTAAPVLLPGRRKYKAAVSEASSYDLVYRWFQSTCRMRYDGVAWRPTFPN